jgi:hypothetical protein
MLAVADVEGGRPGQWVRNKNGTHDLGTMQFNTGYLKKLEKHGIYPAHVLLDGCYPYELAAWRLRKHIETDSGDIWKRAANYHSRTEIYNARYRQKLLKKAQYWEHWLDKNFDGDIKKVKF